MRVYHGTNEHFDTFECPAHFTDNIHTAEFFARRNSGESIVMHCILDFKNPLIVDIDGQSWGGFFLQDEKLQDECVEYAACGDEEDLEYFKEQGITINFLASYAKTLGYDGLIAHDCYEEDGRYSTQYVAFRPEQITVIDKEYVKENDLDER